MVTSTPVHQPTRPPRPSRIDKYKSKSYATGLSRIGRTLFRRNHLNNLKRAQSDSAIDSALLPDCAFIAVPSASPPRNKLTRVGAAILRSTFLGRVLAIPSPPHAKSIPNLPTHDEFEVEEEHLSLSEEGFVDSGNAESHVADVHHHLSSSSSSLLQPPRGRPTPAGDVVAKKVNKPSHSAAPGRYNHTREQDMHSARDVEEELMRQVDEYKSMLSSSLSHHHPQSNTNGNSTAITKQIELYEKTQTKQDELIKTLRSRCQHLDMEKSALHKKNESLNGKILALHKSKVNSLGMASPDKDDETMTWRMEVTDLREEKKRLEEECEEMRKRMEAAERRLEMVRQDEATMRHQTVTEKHEKELIKDHSKLILKENDHLIERITERDQNIEKLKQSHLQEMSLIRKRLEVTEGERRSLESSMIEMGERYGDSVRRVERLKAANVHTISLSEHAGVLEDMHSKVNELELVFKRQLDISQLRQKVLEEDKQRLSVEISEKDVQVKRLAAKLNNFYETLSDIQGYVAGLEIKLEEMSGVEEGYKKHLNAAISVAENAMREREQLALEHHKQGKISEEVRRKLDEDYATMGKMEKRIQLYRANVANKLQEQHNDNEKRLGIYKRNVTHLKSCLDEKDEEMKTILTRNRNLDSNLELLWQQVVVENERMRSLAIA